MLKRIIHWLLKSLQWLFWILLGLLTFHLWNFFRLYADQLVLLTYQHLRMIALAMPPAVLFGVGIGILIYRQDRLSAPAITFAGIIMTIPSIALFGVMIPVLAPLGAGVGTVPAVIALILYSQLPIIRNTYVALKGVPHATIKAGRGMGLSNWQILFKIEIPLAVPTILTGIRQAVVIGIGIAAVAAYIGGGGLGRWIFGGIRRTYPDMVLAGALVTSLLAIGVDMWLRKIQSLLTVKTNQEIIK
jgi:osmoprotectant transport system permease protein